MFLDTYVHVHTEYSNLRIKDSTVKIKDLLKLCKEQGVKSCSITDHEALTGHVEFLNEVNKMKKDGYEIKPILGNEIYVTEDDAHSKNEGHFTGREYNHLILLAKNLNGYKQLCQLSSQAWENGFFSSRYFRVPVDYNDLKKYIKKGDMIISSACFVKDTQVKTYDGYKNIQDCESGDLVLTHTGEYKKIIVPTQRAYNGDIYTCKLQGGNLGISCTDNHKFLVVNEKEAKTIYNRAYHKRYDTKNPYSMYEVISELKPEWKEARNLSSNDIMLTPIDNRIEDINILDISNCEINSNKIKKKLKTYKININNELLQVIGLYVAEGSFLYKQTGIMFTIDSRKQDLIDFITTTIENIFGIAPYVRKKNNQLAVDISFISKELYNVFSQWFIQGAVNKKCPSFIKWLPPERQIYFLKGLYLGDGYYEDTPTVKKNRSKNGRLTYCTISKDLYFDVIHILHRLWYNPTCWTKEAYIDKKSVSRQKAYYIDLNGRKSKKLIDFIYKDKEYDFNNFNGFTYFDMPIKTNTIWYMKNKIVKINKKTEKTMVYCLNVEEDHSFLANNVVVHNCLGGFVGHRLLTMYYAKQEGNIETVKEQAKFLDEWVLKYKDLVAEGDLYFEIQPNEPNTDQWIANKLIVKFAEKYNIPVIVTCDIHYLRPENREAHEVFLRSKDDDNREVASFYKYTYFFTSEELENFLKLNLSEEKYKEIINNTNSVKDKIEIYSLDLPTQMPNISVPDKIEFKDIFKDYYESHPAFKFFRYSDDVYNQLLFKKLEDGFIERVIRDPKKKKKHRYIEELHINLDVLQFMQTEHNKNFSSYFLVVKELNDLIINQADSFMGLSRGSACSFLVNYLLGIVEVDPVRWGLPYWRFMNKSRIDSPD